MSLKNRRACGLLSENNIGETIKVSGLLIYLMEELLLKK